MYEKEFEFIFDYATEKCDDIEILLVDSKAFSVKIDRQEIEAFNYADSKGISVRAIKDGREGYAYSEEFSNDAFQMIVDEALENSKLIESDEIVVLANHPEIDTKLELCNPDLENIDVSEKVTFAKSLESISRELDSRVFNIPYSVMGNSYSLVKIANSKGLDKEEIDNSAYAYVSVLVEENGEKRDGSDFIISRDFSKFDAKKLATNSVNKAINLLNAKDIKSGTYPVVLNNEVMTDMLATFSSIFSAKAVQEGKSLLKGKLGKKVTNEKINIIDNALLADGFASRRFDSEGYPSQKVALIKDGVLTSFLHNTQTAAKDGCQSTGHGTRGIKTSLGVATSNLYLEPGECTEKELFTNHKQTVEIVSLQGLHSGANPISGDFSLSGEGFLWENGKRQHSLKQFTIAGNILEMLNQTEAIANNFRFSMNAVGSAAILIKELSISS